jgi:hypothetical protein
MFFVFFENRAVYEIMWKGIVEPYMQQMTIWRMRIAWWIPKATDTDSECIILFHCNNAYAKVASMFTFILKLLVLFKYPVRTAL